MTAETIGQYDKGVKRKGLSICQGGSTMLKKEAAEFLGVSERAVSRYVVKGRLAVSYRKKEGGGSEAIFDREQVEGLKAEMEAPKTSQPKPEAQSQQLTTKRDRGGELGAILEALSGRARAVPIEAQLVLSLAQAAQLSGLPRRVLVEAIKAERLRGSKDWGRGWRVRRADLLAFVEGL